MVQLEGRISLSSLKKDIRHLFNRDQSMILVLVLVRFTDLANASIDKSDNLKD